MCGLLNGTFFMRLFLFLFILLLAPDALAAATVTQNTINMSLNDMGQWELSDLPATTGPSTISDGPSFYYFTNPNNTPVVDSSGDVTANLPAPALPVPQDSAGISGISAADEVTASDIAAALAPVLANLAGLTPEGRALIVGGSALWSMYENYYNSVNPSASSGSEPLNPTVLSGCTQSPSPGYSCPSGEYPEWFSSSGANSLAGGNYYSSNQVVDLCMQSSGSVGTRSSYITCSSSTLANSQLSSIPSNPPAIPAPTLAQVANMLANNATNSLTALQNLPASTVQALPMTTTLTGPSTATGPSTTSTSTDSSGNTTTTTTTPTYNMTYSGPNASVTTNDNIKTTTCTAAGSCTTTNTTTQPVTQTPFVGPPVNFGPSGLTAALQGMQQTVPFSSIGFGSSWLPQSCPPQPTWSVSLPFGYNQTFDLPTNELCTLASDVRPFVLSGGGVLSLMILAW